MSAQAIAPSPLIATFGTTTTLAGRERAAVSVARRASSKKGLSMRTQTPCRAPGWLVAQQRYVGRFCSVVNYRFAGVSGGAAGGAAGGRGGGHRPPARGGGPASHPGPHPTSSAHPHPAGHRLPASASAGHHLPPHCLLIDGEHAD